MKPSRRSPGKRKPPIHQESALRFELERIRIDRALADGVLELQRLHAVALADLEARSLKELAQQWRSEGRELGPAMLRALGELGQGWKGDPDVST
jgi:hypothetical protein